MNKVFKLALLLLVIGSTACSKSELNTKVSHTTGWNYYDKKMANFEAHAGGYKAPIGMVPIQGGTVTIGEKDEFITAQRDNKARSISVSSFYMDKYEVTNLAYSEYINWLRIMFHNVAPELVEAAMPDQTAWRQELAYNEPFAESYLEHPGFSYYPVVGVSWNQAVQYCKWRTDRVNELALVKAGVMEAPNYKDLEPVLKTKKDKQRRAFEKKYGVAMVPGKVVDPKNHMDSLDAWFPSYEFIRDRFIFSTEKYLLDDAYVPRPGKHPLKSASGKIRKASRMDGLFVISYRLPTEAEWEFAAYAPVAGPEGLTIEGKMYPWTGYHSRQLDPKTKKKYHGMMQANFVRGAGDLAGVSGMANDGYVFTAPVDAFQPNSFGLYNMAGNVNEWVLDVYRETTNYDVTEYNAFRGNVYARPLRDAKGALQLDSLGQIVTTYDPIDDDKRDFRDGDSISIIDTDYPLEIPEKQYAYEPVRDDDGNPTGEVDTIEVGDKVYMVDPTDILCPRITKKTRVYKGGSWADRIYWLNPSSRRYLDQDKCSATIGFRCAMSTLGDQIPNTPMKH